MEEKSLALAYLTQSIKYLDLAEKIFEQMVNKGNPHVVTSIGGKHEPESIWKDYCEQTKWSDFNIIFPALFIFYHGIELMIKGLFPLMGSEIPFGHIDHKSDLLDKLKNEKGIKIEIIEKIDKYLNFEKLKGTPLGDWMEINNININDLYERLRYPTDKSHLILTDNLPLKYQGEKMIPFAKQIIKDSKRLREVSVSQLNEIYPH